MNWSELIDVEHYQNQEQIYKTFRPTLLTNTLVVPTGKIVEHIRDLSSNDCFGIKQQVEAFHRTNDQRMENSQLVSTDTLNNLQTYTIEVDF